MDTNLLKVAIFNNDFPIVKEINIVARKIRRPSIVSFRDTSLKIASAAKKHLSSRNCEVGPTLDTTSIDMGAVEQTAPIDVKTGPLIRFVNNFYRGIIMNGHILKHISAAEFARKNIIIYDLNPLTDIKFFAERGFKIVSFIEHKKTESATFNLWDEESEYGRPTSFVGPAHVSIDMNYSGPESDSNYISSRLLSIISEIE